MRKKLIIFVGKFDAVVAINENKPILDFDVEKFVVR